MSVFWGSPVVVGHRGGRGDGWPPENTLAAFEQARRQGASAIELDVRTCAAGGIVVFHDDTLKRMTGGRDARRVADVAEDELAGIDLGGGATIPRLSAVLAWARANEVGVNVEMKHDVPHRRPLARGTVEDIRVARADVLLSSFDPVLLAMTAAMAPDLPRALLTHLDQGRWASGVQEAARPPAVQAIHLERTQADAGAVARYRRRGLRVGVWTVNDPAEARELARLGVGSIITDRPGELQRALQG